MIGVQTPEIVSVPDYVSSAGGEAIELAALAGLRLDDWQQYVLTHSLGERADGKWAAPTVGLVVGRQNGKNSILEARELCGLFLLDERVIVHSAHEQATSSEHFRRLLALIEGVPEFDRRVLKVVQGKGSEAIELRGGQRVLFKTRTGGGGRGFSVDLLVFDEAMILSAAAKAALIPTMAARSMEGNTQTWYAGSAVDQMNPKHDGLELSRIREQGIKGHDRVAYFEWSVPPWTDKESDFDPGMVPVEIASDPANWAKANPGLGIRIAEEWVEHERTVELGDREFAVERLGVGDWPDPSIVERPIEPAAWAALLDAESKMLDPVCFAFDIAPDRSSAAIGVAGARTDGKRHLETVEGRRGTAWVVPRLVELCVAHKAVGVVCDGRSPAASLVPELEEALKGAGSKIEVTIASGADHAQACGIIFDAVKQETIHHLGTGDLSTAIRGATKRPLGDAWAWSRKSSNTDISPLVAVTLALWGFQTIERPKGRPRAIDLSTV